MSRPFRLSSPAMPFIIRLVDVAIIGLSGWGAIAVRRMIEPVDLPADMTGYHALITGAALLFLALSKSAYRSWRGSAILSMLARVTGTWLLALGLILLWLFLLKSSDNFSRLWFLIWVFGALALLWLERLVVYFLLRLLRRHGFNLKHVALIGDGEAAENLLRRLDRAGWTGYRITRYPVMPTTLELEALAERSLDEVWLALPIADEAGIRHALHGLRHASASIRLTPDWLTYRLINHGISDLLGVPMLDLTATPLTGLNSVIKLVEDRVLSMLILILITPLMGVLALGVKFSSPGPVFYRQLRVGLNNRPFQMLKFRSMPVEVEKERVRWGGAAEKTSTRFGRFIRQTSLDELPQFINVLKGEMSIVGPRPERPMFVEQFKDEIPDYMKKHMVKAGITGWAQIHGWRGDSDLRMRIEHDLYYIEHWSLWLDLKIILLTLFRGMNHKNAR